MLDLLSAMGQATSLQKQTGFPNVLISGGSLVEIRPFLLQFRPLNVFVYVLLTLFTGRIRVLFNVSSKSPWGRQFVSDSLSG